MLGWLIYGNREIVAQPNSVIIQKSTKQHVKHMMLIDRYVGIGSIF